MTMVATPIIFNARGMVLDTRIKVFDAEFHVSSGVLKLHSAFFFNFLNSVEKTQQSSTTPDGFRYEWLTKVNEDGTWSMMAAKLGQTAPHSNIESLKGDKEEHMENFYRLLCAFYGIKYQITDLGELLKLTEMADYYCALPRLSATIVPAMTKSVFELIRDAEDEGIQLVYAQILSSAIKLREPSLFRDALSVFAGDRARLLYEETVEMLPDTVQRCAQIVRHGINARIVAAQEDILELAEGDQRDFGSKLAQVRGFRSKYDPRFSLPKYYRQLADATYNDKTCDQLQTLHNLLQNNLRIQGRSHEAGRGDLDTFFLCGEFDDKDLPWDASQLDW